jgi:predicted O-linked N-acetylglucosamine transferase (SPINDLY family)
MLEMLDLPELIARDDDDYVDISVRLLADEEFYNDMKQKIVDRKQRLFSDQEVSLAFKKAIEILCVRSP